LGRDLRGRGGWLRRRKRIAHRSAAGFFDATQSGLARHGMRSPLFVGESVQLTATVSYSDGSTRDITREERWINQAAG
jgi:hypothetical protein